MNPLTPWWQRLGMITTLVERAPNQTLGRTAIVKLAYLLQTRRHVPLGYDFRLHTYGPYDADVLNDLASAQTLGAVQVKTLLYPVGYGYEVRPGVAADTVKDRGRELLTRYQEEIDWVLREFGSRTAADLELISTIVYVDRELASPGEAVAIEELARRVREVKPHFAEAYVLATIKGIQEKELLLSLPVE
jgi:uncharacterized protein YwgA